MARKLRLLRGTAEQNNAYAGLEGEVTFDTTNKQVRLHDGSVKGGYKIPKIQDLANVATSGSYNDLSNKPTLIKGTVSGSGNAVTDISVDGHTITLTKTTFNNYSHPVTNGNKHIPADGAAGQFLKWSAAGTAQWANIPTYANVSDTASGLMTADQKKKLDGIAANANNYTHPNSGATAGTAGTSSATSGSTLAVPYVTVNAQGHVTGYGTHTHTISGFLTSHQDISGKANLSGAAFTGAVSAPSFQATSDIRLKHDIEDYDTDLTSIHAKKYVLDTDGLKHIGIIAQDVQKICPEAVFEDEKGFLSVDYNTLVAILINKVNLLESKLRNFL